MIISVAELKSMEKFKDMDDVELSMMAKSIEELIRAYTNNNFQKRAMRIEAETSGGHIVGTCPYFKKGDTIQISQSDVNDGLYVITEIRNGFTYVDGDLFDNAANTVTKVVYPVDVKMGVVNLLSWETDNREKVGVKSETISRHTVTYYDQDANNQAMGYPASLLGFLKPYMRARF